MGILPKKSEKEIGDMGKNGEKAGSSLAETFKKVIGVLAALAVAGFKDFAGQAAEAAQQAQVVQTSFESTFGESSKDVENWSGNFANAIHRNETEVKSFLVSNK
ncbi:MAG: hypothetical protein LBC56_03915, partial [Oscillospiraceae bacterium]|nr:hypothetical protein [Oscillospiraceae bacterium]